MSRPTVVVIGAGIIGASCAYHLAARGAKVTVLERAPNPAMGSTGKSAAGVRHQFSHPENVRLSLYSSRAFARFEQTTGVSAGYRRVGYLFLVPAERWDGWLEQVRMQAVLGARVEVLERETLRQRYPYLETDGLAGASFGPDDGVVDPHAITLGYLQRATELGAKVRCGVEVTAVQRSRGGWRLEGEHSTLTADYIVNAAGAFAGELARRAGLEVPVTPYRRNVYTTSPLLGVAHPIPLIVDAQTGVWLRSEGKRFIFGLSNPDEPPGDNQAVDWGWLERVLTLALPRFPLLARAGLDARACWAGLYEVTPDHAPILGRMASAPTFVNACGFSGHGVQHSPAAGLIVTEEVLDGAAHSFDMQGYRLERFEQGAVNTGQNTEQNTEQNVV